MRPDRTKPVTITLTTNEHAELTRLARKHGVHQSTMIRAALLCYNPHGLEDVRRVADSFRTAADHLADGRAPLGLPVAEPDRGRRRRMSWTVSARSGACGTPSFDHRERRDSHPARGFHPESQGETDRTTSRILAV